MLAMKFEETIFQSAKSFDDYKKTIQKRLTKLKKHYAKMQQQQQLQQQQGAGNAPSDDLLREREILLERELRDTYGSRILYIVKHADLAVELTREKHGDGRADILKQHAISAKNWAERLGLLPSTAFSEGGDGHAADAAATTTRRMDMATLTKLKGQLESRVETIRSHIVKLADPDLFLEESLRKLDEEILLSQPFVSRMLRSSLLRYDPDLRRRQPQPSQQQSTPSSVFTVDQMKKQLERTNAPVPIPRRNHRDDDRIRAAVVRIDKVRAAVQVLATYMAMSVEEKTADSSFRGCLNHCHKVVMECCDALEEEYEELVREAEGGIGEDGEGEEEGPNGSGSAKRAVLLEDAWNRALTLKEDEEEAVGHEQVALMEEVEAEGKEPDAKRVKLENRAPKRPVVIKTRILLTPGRHIFPTLIPQLRRKKAILVRNGTVAYVKLEFGTAFEMTIYFMPLLVTIRAMAMKSFQEEEGKEQKYLPTVSLAGCLRWPSSYQGLGLAPSSDISTSSATPNTQNGINNGNNKNILSGSGGKQQQHGNLSVLGATGPAVGHIVAKKLEYASARATHVLRRCFADAISGKGALAKTEYEIELLETGALIRFLQIARNTYNPGWVDID